MFTFSSRKLQSLFVLPGLFPLIFLFAGRARETDVPTAVDDSYTVHACAIPLRPDLTANDSNPDGNAITVAGFPQLPEDYAANRSAMVAYDVPLATLTGLGPAQMWVGLKNSDDVGTKFDLLTEIFKNGSLVGSGQLNDVLAGSSGFNNAKLDTINLALSGIPTVVTGDTLSIRLSARIAASSGHRSGTARLWFNDASANSRFTAIVGETTNNYFQRSGFVLSTTAGPGPKNTIDVLVDRAVAGNPFKPFGTWSKTF